jgi:AmmeMemoRadiSam system protein B
MKNKLLIVIGLLLVMAGGLIVNYQLLPANKIKGVHSSVVSDDDKLIAGIILPHHNFAKDIIIDAYEKLREYDYDLVVIISPNHFHPEIGDIISTQTLDANQFDVELDQVKIKQLLEKELIKTDQTMFDNEHGITVHLEYLAEFFPNIKVLPLMMPTNPNPQQLQELKAFLANISEQTLFLASVDFAHNLTYLEAIENNQESIDAITHFDYQQISQFNDQHLDSPQSINLLLQIMQKKNNTDFQVWYNTHGALLSDQPNLVGTSYVVAIFH